MTVLAARNDRAGVRRRAAAMLLVGLLLGGCTGTDPDSAPGQVGATPTSATSSGTEATAQPSATAPGSTTTSAEPTLAANAELCGAAEQIGADLRLFDTAETDDPAGFPARVAAAADRFATITPPEEIATAWSGLAEFLAWAAERLQGRTIRTEDDVKAALKTDDAETFSRALRLPGQIEVIGVHLQDACGIDLGITPPPVDNACALLEDPDLAIVFGGSSAPAGGAMRWGDGIVECRWSVGERELGVATLPADQLEAVLVDGRTPVDTVTVADSQVAVYDDAFGPLRTSPGRTAVVTVDDTAVLVSVATGDDSADAESAVALVHVILGRLPG